MLKQETKEKSDISRDEVRRILNTIPMYYKKGKISFVDWFALQEKITPEQAKKIFAIALPLKSFDEYYAYYTR